METAASDARVSPFLPMFESFRTELDEHHDRRERVTKTSRDITAASKKMIFAMQRVRNPNRPLPSAISKSIQPHQDAIRKLFSAVTPELQSINAYRYNRQISPGIQEYMESRIFQHYLETQTLLSYDDASAELNALAAAVPATESDTTLADGMPHTTRASPQLLLTPDDYLLGIFDATGELMRFAITSMATAGSLPVDADRTVLNDLQALRILLSTLEARARFEGSMGREVGKKMDVMLASVDKVERALYGLTIRGSERPKGWMPDLSAGGGGGREAQDVDVEA